jgi:hypothetical protein
MDNSLITELDEKRLDELLAYTPNYSSQNSKNIENMFLQKGGEQTKSDSHRTTVSRKPIKRVLLAAAIAALTLALSFTALAVTGVIDFGRFYNSIFSNPASSPYIAVPEASTDATTENTITVIGSSDDLTIEPVAGFVGGEWNLYIQLKLIAHNDVTFSDTLYIFDGDYMINLGDTTVTRIDERTAIISFRTHDGRRDSENGTIGVKFDAVSSVPYRITKDGNPDSASTVSMPVSSSDTTTYYGDWEVVVSANNVIDTRFVDGSFERRAATVRIEPTVVEIQVFSSEAAPYLFNSDGRIDYRYDPEGKIRITLTDGRVIEEARIESICDVGGDGSGMASYWCSIEFVNPADVFSVELFGETVIDKSSD